MMVVSVWMFLARWADTEREEDDEEEDVAAAESTSDWLFLIAVWLKTIPFNKQLQICY